MFILLEILDEIINFTTKYSPKFLKKLMNNIIDYDNTIYDPKIKINN